MRKPTPFALWFVAGAVLLGGAASALAETFTTIDYPGARFTSPTGINASGSVVGQYIDAANGRHGFLWNDGVFTSIDYPGAVLTNAWGINSQGDVVGDYADASGNHAFVLSNGSYTSVDVPAATTGSFGFGIDPNGTMVGEYKKGQVIGQTGFAWMRDNQGNFFDITPPGATNAIAWATNPRGDAVGLYLDASGNHAWLRDQHGNFSTIDFPGGFFSNARGINARGEVVGVYRTAATGNKNRGFLRDQHGSYISIDVAGSSLTRALGISASGEVVGDYGLPGSPVRHGFIRTP